MAIPAVACKHQDAEWRAMVAQPETLNVGELNHAVKFLRERLYQQGLQLMPSAAPHEKPCMDPNAVRNAVKRQILGEITMTGLLNELYWQDTRSARKFYDAVSETEATTLAEICEEVGVDLEEIHEEVNEE